MIGITEIANYIPESRQDNRDKLDKFDIDEEFIDLKIGFKRTSRKSPGERSSDLCVKSFHSLIKKIQIEKEDIDFLCVCTQNGDYSLPHTSAVVHQKLSLPKTVAAFDISLGCSGYVYGLHVCKSFMEANDLKKGLFFTCDPYSEILDSEDKNTELLFGDAATVTFLSDQPILDLGKAVFESAGEKHETLIKKEGEKLFMNGREIFNFVVKSIPLSVKKCLQKNNITMEEVDILLFHQASKFVLDQLRRFLKVNEEKLPFKADDFGNTVSSTIPLLLEEYIHNKKYKTFLASGFGVGLSSGTSLIRRI